VHWLLAFAPHRRPRTRGNASLVQSRGTLARSRRSPASCEGASIRCHEPSRSLLGQFDCVRLSSIRLRGGLAGAHGPRVSCARQAVASFRFLPASRGACVPSPGACVSMHGSRTERRRLLARTFGARTRLRRPSPRFDGASASSRMTGAALDGTRTCSKRSRTSAELPLIISRGR
jgi:hypothetical protein